MSEQGQVVPDEDAGDVAPGDLDAGRHGLGRGVTGYLIGLALATLLTIASFTVVGTHLIWGPGIPVALATLAIAQMGIHLVFFLHLTSGPDNTNNALALAFGVLIVFLVMAGTVWIMAHLNQNMMPMSRIIEMQR